MQARYTHAAALAGLLAATLTYAQNGTPPAPSAQRTDPTAASSPHQRAVTKTPADETAAASGSTNPSAASTPHQKKTTKKPKTATPTEPNTTP
jgi:hypothetical protein